VSAKGAEFILGGNTVAKFRNLSMIECLVLSIIDTRLETDVNRKSGGFFYRLRHIFNFIFV
jgi:hypothetical protein